MTFKFEILTFGQEMKMDHINIFKFIHFSIMDEFHPMILFYLIQIINKIHPYEIIHL
jgi:hypothetical protein